jgi:hypothetical protein
MKHTTSKWCISFSTDWTIRMEQSSLIAWCECFPIPLQAPNEWTFVSSYLSNNNGHDSWVSKQNYHRMQSFPFYTQEKQQQWSCSYRGTWNIFRIGKQNVASYGHLWTQHEENWRLSVPEGRARFTERRKVGWSHGTWRRARCILSLGGWISAQLCKEGKKIMCVR